MDRLVRDLATTWTSIEALCAPLSEDEWKLPTGCPGWSVQDNVSHLVDYEAKLLGRPAPDHVPADLSHTKNDMGRANEVGVDVRRSRSGAEVLAEFRDVTAERIDRLSRATDDELGAETMTPAGRGTVRDLLALRVMDSWSHEQDIRRALGRPGHLEGSAVDTAIAHFNRFLPYVAGKRAAAPDGAVIVVDIGDRAPVTIEVADGRARAADATDAANADPTVRLRIPVGQYAALVGGRSDADPDAVEIVGDVGLGRRIVDALGFMP